MQRKFYYHPDNAKAVVDAVILGVVKISSPAELVEDRFIPTEDSKGKPVLGFWMDVWELSDWMIVPLPDERLLAYPRMLNELAQMISGVPPQ